MKRTLSVRRMILIVGLLGAVIYSNPSRVQALNGPALVLAQGLTDTTIQLTWMAVSGASSYSIYRGGSLVASQPGTLYNDSSLSPGTTYRYQVSAVVNGAESQLSSSVSATTQAQHDSSAPSQPGTITVSNIASDKATLQWGASSDNVGVLGYRILRGAPGAPLSALTQIATSEGTTTYSATNLFASTNYQFAVLALDAAGNLSAARTVTLTTAGNTTDVTAPAAPSNTSVSPKVFSASRVDLVWGASTSTDVSGYQIYRDGALVGEVDLPLRRYYSDNGVAPGSTHAYQLQAVDSAGNLSALTTAKSVTTLASGTVKIVRGPYIQWTTTTSARIAWWTNIQAPSTVKYGVGSLTSQVNDPVLTYQHVMLIGDLSPATVYTYQVVSGTASSTNSTFTTAPLSGSTFTFAAVGDFGGGSTQETAIANKIAADGTQFTVTLGDDVYPDAQDPNFPTTYSDFDARFYKPYTTVMSRQTLWLAGGNHEYYGDGAYWKNIWMPNNERWYSFDWGDAHFLVLDTEVPFASGSPQYQFAQADLSANQSKNWRIVVLHRPPYSSSSNSSSSTAVRSSLVPLLEQQHVQLVLTGHSHNYERTYPLIGGVPQTTGGVTYIVSGGGGNGLNAFTVSQPSWSAFRQSTYESLRITVSPNSIQLNAVNDAGTVFDSATISSSGGTMATNTPTVTASPTATKTSAPANTATNTPTLSASPTATQAATATNTPTAGASPTSTVTPFNTATPTATQTPTTGPTATRTLTPTATATLQGTLTFITVADARVAESAPTTNYGTSTNLQADAGSGVAQNSFMRFNVSGITGSIQSAKLRVYCTTNGTNNGPASYLADSNWIESGTGGVTWDTQPALLSGASANTAAFGTATWVEFDVTPLVTGDGTYTFALVADSTDGVTFSSREGTNPPQLFITLGP